MAAGFRQPGPDAAKLRAPDAGAALAVTGARLLPARTAPRSAGRHLPSAMLGRIRSRIECAMVIRMVIQTIELHPTRPDQIDAASHVSRDDPTPPVVSD
jgi:hypothetical protein